MILNALIIRNIIYKNLARECTHFGKYGVNCYFLAKWCWVRIAYPTNVVLNMKLNGVPNLHLMSHADYQDSLGWIFWPAFVRLFPVFAPMLGNWLDHSGLSRLDIA